MVNNHLYRCKLEIFNDLNNYNRDISSGILLLSSIKTQVNSSFSHISWYRDIKTSMRISNLRLISLTKNDIIIKQVESQQLGNFQVSIFRSNLIIIFWILVNWDSRLGFTNGISPNTFVIGNILTDTFQLF